MDNQKIGIIKLRIIAMAFRLQELRSEADETRQRRRLQFEKEPIMYIKRPELPKLQFLYDKKGKPFDPPKSKYHK